MYISELHKFEPFRNKVWPATPAMHGEKSKYITEAYEINWMSKDVGADIFARGVCLPSDNKMIPEEKNNVIEAIRACFD